MTHVVVGVPRHEIARQVAETLDRIFEEQHRNAQLSLDEELERKLGDAYQAVACLVREVRQLRSDLERRVKR